MNAVEDAEYLVARLRDRLAEDTAGELGLRIDLRSGRVTVRGTVLTEQRRAAVERIVRHTLRGLVVDTDIALADHRPPEGAEDLP